MDYASAATHIIKEQLSTKWLNHQHNEFYYQYAFLNGYVRRILMIML